MRSDCMQSLCCLIAELVTKVSKACILSLHIFMTKSQSSDLRSSGLRGAAAQRML